MDAAKPLADLLELSPQIEAAAVFRGEEILGAAGVGDEAARRLVDDAVRLLDSAGKLRSDGSRVAQVRAALSGRSVFVVQQPEGERAAVAVAAGGATPGLVFFDLKRTLAAVAEERATPRGRRAAKEDTGSAA